jgi:hypothetical protein
MRVRDTRAEFSRRFASREKSFFRSDDAMLGVRSSGIRVVRTSGSCAVNRPRKCTDFPMKRTRRDVVAKVQALVRRVHRAGTCRCAAGVFLRAMPACAVRDKRHVPVIIARVAFLAPRRACGIAQVRHPASAGRKSAREGRFVSTNLDDGSASAAATCPAEGSNPTGVPAAREAAATLRRPVPAHAAVQRAPVPPRRQAQPGSPA